MTFATTEREELFDEEYETGRTPESYDRERDIEHDKDENDFEDARSIDNESFDSGSLAAAEAAGGAPEDWESAGAGSDGWIFDGEKIFNPATGETYGGHSSEAEVRHQEAVRHMQEGGGTYFHESTWREETADGTMISTIHLVFGAADSAGIRAVGWEMHTMRLPRGMEEEAVPKTQESGTPAVSSESFATEGYDARPEREQEQIHSLLERLLHFTDEEKEEQEHEQKQEQEHHRADQIEKEIMPLPGGSQPADVGPIVRAAASQAQPRIERVFARMPVRISGGNTAPDTSSERLSRRALGSRISRGGITLSRSAA